MHSQGIARQEPREPRGPGRWEAQGQSTYVRCEHGVAGRGLVHGHREAEGAGPQAAVLQQWDPLGRGWGSGDGRAGARQTGEGEAG